MKFWKEKNLFPVLSVVFLLGLLVLLAGLQYKWLGQISDAEREHLQSRLQDDTRRFAEDFNREIQTVYFNFQINAEDFKNQNWNDFNKSLISWHNQTQFPELIKDFYFIKNDDSQTLLKFDVKKSDFEKVEWTNDLKNISRKLNNENSFNPILENRTALAIPILDKNDGIKQIIIRTREINSENIKTESKMQLPPKYGFLIIFLDENVIKNQIIPTLVNKYFSNTENADYKISITNRENQTVFQTNGENVTSPDSTAKIFSLKPNNFTFIRKNDGDISSDSQAKKENTFIYNKNFSTKTVTSEKNEVLTVNIKKADEEKPRIAIFEGNGENFDGIWTLNLQHSDGSLEQFVTNTRRRNLAVSFGILSLLAASVALIFISAQRSKKLAQRQLDFVSSVSHEFRTPLAVIYSAGENLTDGVVNSRNQISKYGNLIKGEGRKLTAMVEQILEFAGARSGKRKYDFRRTNIE
ncbi:MAG: histidine kinase dimerization/phospho-acceptor domain-containing protein, partial [Acidobacteriota bacterium]